MVPILIKTRDLIPTDLELPIAEIHPLVARNIAEEKVLFFLT